MGTLHPTPKQVVNGDTKTSAERRETALEDGDARLSPRKRDLFLYCQLDPQLPSS